MGNFESVPASPSHDNRLDGWAPSDTYTGRSPINPSKRQHKYQPSFLESHRMQQPKAQVGGAVRKLGAPVPSAVVSDYMLEHAKKAAEAIPAGLAYTSKSVNFTARPNVDGQTVLIACQKKAQMELSPSKTPPRARIDVQPASHVGSDALILTATKSFTEGEKHVNGITSVWNKFADGSQTRSKDGSVGYQGIDGNHIQEVFKAGKNTHQEIIPSYIGIPAKITGDAYETKFQKDTYAFNRPPDKKGYLGVKPNSAGMADWSVTEYQDKQNVIKQHQNFATPAKQYYMGPDAYMLEHAKATKSEPMPLSHQRSAEMKPTIPPASYEAEYQQAAREVARAHPDPAEYQGLKPAHTDEEYILVKQRKVHAEVHPDMVRSKEMRGTPQKADIDHTKDPSRNFYTGDGALPDASAYGA